MLSGAGAVASEPEFLAFPHPAQIIAPTSMAIQSTGLNRNTRGMLVGGKFMFTNGDAVIRKTYRVELFLIYLIKRHP
jgi:hypothetical protein